MGNFLRHSYDRVSNEIVWNAVKEDLPVLKTIVEEALRAQDQRRWKRAWISISRRRL
jgi:uncharacterized protein with HEPN domain